MRPSEIILDDGRNLSVVIELHHRWLLSMPTGARADLSRADLSGADLTHAVLSGAALTGANLTRADLSGADLSGADLSHAVLSGADLSRADLTCADLTCADLTRADLSGADLSDADLTHAVLTRSVLTRGVLTDADLTTIEADVQALVRNYPTHEVLGLLRALYLGRVDGSTYVGRCACLVGTLANTKQCDMDDLPHNPARAAERWALGIAPGDAAPHHPIATLTARWIEAELAGRADYVPGTYGDGDDSTAEGLEAQALALLYRARVMKEA